MFVKEFSLAKKVAIDVGNFLKKQDSRIVDSSEGRDIKLELDRKAEEWILYNLNEHTNFSILTEESGLLREIKPDEPYWIIDPIDGSLNYSRNSPLCCVSIALWMNEAPLLGVVNDFNSEELFSGLVGEGAWLNDTELSNQRPIERSQAILATGFPTYLSTTKEYLDEFLTMVNAYKKIRMFGSAALSLCYVACGRVDVYYESQIKLWDIAAGVAINKAIGNNVNVIFQDNYSTITEVGI